MYVKDQYHGVDPCNLSVKIYEHIFILFITAEGLKTSAVDSYIEIEAKMEEGTMNRTVASTNMNATSSRAHTIVGIIFVQKYKNAAGEETAKSSVVNLVDLAGRYAHWLAPTHFLCTVGHLSSSSFFWSN